MTYTIKKISRITALIAGLAVITVLIPVNAFADQYQYGGTPIVTQITLNKMVQEPSTGNFVDNLGVDNERFQAGENVTYRLVVTNTGNTSYGFVNVTDTLPSYLDFVSGPGDYNTTNRQITYRIENLTPGATDTRDIHARVVAQNQLPSAQGVFCIVNTASLTTNVGNTASDTAQLCIGKQAPGTAVPVTTLPSTGYADYIFAILGMAVIGTGLALRKAK